MSRKIVVPIEGSARDGEALAVARDIAHRVSTGIVLVHVAPLLFDTQDVVAAEQRLDELARELRADGIEAHFLMEYGDPALGIADVARGQNAEMIVLAPEHRALLEALWHPRVSGGLLGQANVPLFMLPDVEGAEKTAEILSEPDAKVILALDGSVNAEAALPMAIMLAQSYNRPLLLVRVVAPIFILGAGVEAIQAQRDAEYAEEVEAHRYLVAMRKQIAAETELDVATVELVGSVADHLAHLAASHPGSLLVMGTHGRGGLKRLLIGSVAADVLGKATSPLVIVPSKPPRDTPKG